VIARLQRVQRLLAALWLALLFQPLAAMAHEARPAYLAIDEVAPGQFSILWRTPVLSGMRLPVVLGLPAGLRDLRPPQIDELTDSRIERRWVDAGPGDLEGKRIDFLGLQMTITDVFVRIARFDGAHSTEIVRPSRPYIDIPTPRGALSTAQAFILQGIEHILFGADHLLFVLGLLLIVKNRWMLVKTITAFTVAHSLTLAAATLGSANIPAPPLNAAIALSILFLGPEVVRSWRGETSFTLRHPWVVAFAFGLLHGFGFASGLTALGLPRGEVPLALLSFNIGVEIGQLGFVALILLLLRAFQILDMRWPLWLQRAPGYVVGSLGAFWTIQRVAAMVSGG
jgi:hydrogenase/urease accessory protein HupE